METTKWKENVVLVDADYVDGVAFHLAVNFERMLERAVPPADLAQWLVCVALDGGVKPGNNEVQVVFVHPKGKRGLDNFRPSSFSEEIDGMAFMDGHVGEFTMSALRVENLVGEAEFFSQAVETLADAKEIKRLILVADPAKDGERLRGIIAKTDGKDVTWLSMEQLSGKGFVSEILGFSLMNAMGIRGEEFK